jgi:hypothetical protein
MIEYFDIGNHLELAAKILARPQYDIAARHLSYNVDTNRAVYIAASGSKPRHSRFLGAAAE